MLDIEGGKGAGEDGGETGEEEVEWAVGGEIEDGDPDEEGQVFTVLF